MKTLYAGACLILVSSVLATAPLRADDWQSYQHDPARTGRSTAVINPRKLTVGWKAPVGYSTPLIVGDRIYSTRNGQGIGGSATVITAFELATGAVIWSYSANFTFPSQAAVGGGFVVFQNGSSGGEGAQLYVLDAATGALRYKVPGVAGNLMPLIIAEPSAGSDDAVTAYCAGGSTLQAVQLGAESGSILWTQTGSFGGSSMPTLVGRSIVLAGPGQYYAFDRASGTRNHFHSGSISGGGGVTVAYDASRGKLYVLTAYGSGSGQFDILTAYRYISNSQIELAWQKTGPGIRSGGSVAIGPTGNLYAADSFRLIKIDPESGATIGSVAGSFAAGMTPAVTAGVIWTFSDSGTTFAYDVESLQLIRTLSGSRGSLNSAYNSPGAFTNRYFALDYGTIYNRPGFDVYRELLKSDFDGNDHPDLIWQNNATGERAIWLMNGTAGERFLPTVTLQWQIAGTGDFNSDGHNDIIWQNSSTGQRAIWLMNRTTWVAERFLPTVGLEWQIAGTGHFDSDGHIDILWQNSVTGQRAIWLMNGTTWAGERFLPTVGLEWQIAATADFNKDGHTDIVWQNNTTGQRAIWLMNGTTWVGERFLPTVGLEWQIAGSADFTKDGETDIVWQNSATGQRAIWLMNGTTWTGERFLPTIPTNWSIQNR
jgi:hypothetical protein